MEITVSWMKQLFGFGKGDENRPFFLHSLTYRFLSRSFLACI